MLNHYIPDGKFKLQTDASKKGISGILYKTGREGNHNVINLVSRCPNEAGKHYTTSELELLAIVYSIIKCQTYLMGVEFKIITDHQALTFLN